jgi:AsmA protein
MRTLIKAVLLLLVLAIAGLISLPFFIDPNDYKQDIAEQVEKATGRELKLDGDIHLSVFPWIALEMGPVSLSNAKGFSADSFAKVNAAQIRIKLLPLLKKQLEMDTVVLDGLVLNLETNKAGKTNWDDLAGSQAKAKTSPASKESTAKDDATPALAAVSIAGVKLTNANILWSDKSTGQQYQLNNLNLETDPLRPGKPTVLNLEFDLLSKQPELKAHTTLSGTAVVDLQQQRYQLDDLKFTTSASGKGIPVNQASLSLQGDISADMAQQIVKVKDLVLETAAKNETQDLKAKLSAQLESHIGTQKTTITGLNLNAELKDPALPGKEANITLSSNVSADLKQQTVSLAGLIVELNDMLSLNGDINASKVLSNKPVANGNIKLNALNPRQLASAVGIALPETADKSTLQLLAMDTQFSGSSDSFAAKNLTISLDQSKITGQLAINNFAKPAINFALKLDQIDADRYLPPQAESKAPPAAKNPAAPAQTSTVAESEALPLDAIRQLNAKGTVDIGNLKISNVRSENIHLSLNAKQGLVKLNPLRASLYQGSYNGNVQLDARGKTLSVAIDEQLKGVQAGPLLKDFSGDDTVSGIASLKVKLSGTGNTPLAIQQTLNGKGNFSFTNGAVKGVNIAESIRVAKAAIKGEKLPESSAPLQTDFSSLTGSFTAKNGLISNQDLAVMSPLLRITGAGTANLPTQSINYGLTVGIVETSKGQGGKALDDLKGLNIPVKITGTFSNPKPQVDLSKLLKEKAKQEVKQKASEKLKEKLGIDLGDILGGSSSDAEQNSSEPADSATEPAKPEDVLKQQLKDKLKSFF